jgi:hypothetical protein
MYLLEPLYRGPDARQELYYNLFFSVLERGPLNVKLLSNLKANLLTDILRPESGPAVYFYFRRQARVLFLNNG